MPPKDQKCRKAQHFQEPISSATAYSRLAEEVLQDREKSPGIILHDMRSKAASSLGQLDLRGMPHPQQGHPGPH